MMRQKGPVLLIAVLLLLLASCAAQFTFIAPGALSEATELKAQCAQQKSGSAVSKTADSLFSAGELLVKKGKNEAAYLLLDRTIVLYRIDLMQQAIAKKDKELAMQEKALSKTREDVSAYQQVLKELKTMEQQ